MSGVTKNGPASARDRLLAAADELFYAGGIHTVGIDTIIERAGVAKATLYSAFGSKDGLVLAYLEARDDARRTRVLTEVDKHTEPVARLLGVFDSLSVSLARPGFRGCPFSNATAESDPDSVAAQATRVARRWMSDLLVELASEAGVADPDSLAAQLALIYDGTFVQSRPDCDPALAIAARAAAETLVRAALQPAIPVPA
jgi:AcrR family transcriptional regulator